MREGRWGLAGIPLGQFERIRVGQLPTLISTDYSFLVPISRVVPDRVLTDRYLTLREPVVALL